MQGWLCETAFVDRLAFVLAISQLRCFRVHPYALPKEREFSVGVFCLMLVLPWVEITEGEAQMNVNGVQGVDEMLRSL